MAVIINHNSNTNIISDVDKVVAKFANSLYKSVDHYSLGKFDAVKRSVYKGHPK